MIFFVLLSLTLSTVHAEHIGPIGNDDKFDVVVIDAGHGGKDPGAIGSKIREKDMALKLALKLGKKIEKMYPDIKVVYTRKKDKFVKLHERAKIANDAKADLFISIHCNSVANPNPNGSETWVLGLPGSEANMEVAKRENSVILLEDDYEQNYDYDPNSKVGHILLSMTQDQYLDKSISFASKIEKYSLKETPRKSRGVKQNIFLVQKKTFAPSVLIEAGFLSNKKDESYMMSSKGQEEITNSILKAFGEYKAEEDQEYRNSQYYAKNNKQLITKSPSAATSRTNSKVDNSSLPSYAQNGESSKMKTNTSSNTTTTQRNQSLSSSNSQKKQTGVITETETVVKKTLPKASGHVEYFIQLAAVSKKGGVSGSKWNKYNDKLLVRFEKGLYKYQLGGYSSHQTAELLKKELSEAFPGAFVVAYKGGEKISIDEAMASAQR